MVCSIAERNDLAAEQLAASADSRGMGVAGPKARPVWVAELAELATLADRRELRTARREARPQIKKPIL